MKIALKAIFIIIACMLVLMISLRWSRPRPKLGVNNHSAKTSLFDVASGDTNNEVLRTILAKQQKLEKTNQTLARSNQQLQQHLQHQDQQILHQLDQQVEQKIAKVQTDIKQQLLLHDHQQPYIKHPQEQYPVGEHEQQQKQADANSSYSGVIGDVADLSMTLVTSHTDNSHVKATMDPPSPPLILSEQGKSSQQQLPYYTLPANATLNHLSLMSAIIAEVPVSGHLIAPAFPFKAIVGRHDLFAANGASLPAEISGMVLEGYSVGNMTMSCARAYVTRLLFVFEDGHFVVYPKHSLYQQATDLYPKDALGYLSDAYGNTCISGRYITNAPRVIANLVAISTAGGIGSAVAQAQTTTMTDASQASTIISGKLGQYTAGMALGYSSQQVLKWYLNRVSGVFDAVYIPASRLGRPTQLVLNMTQTIPIDLDLTGRRLRDKHHMALGAMAHHLD